MDIFWSKNRTTPGQVLSRFLEPGGYLAESDEFVLFKVTCFSEYQLIGNVFHFCVDGEYRFSIPSETVCKSKFMIKVK